jgi:hypothetical protein
MKFFSKNIKGTATLCLIISLLLISHPLSAQASIWDSISGAGSSAWNTLAGAASSAAGWASGVLSSPQAQQFGQTFDEAQQRSGFKSDTGVSYVRQGLTVSASQAGLSMTKEATDLPGMAGRAINYMFGIIGVIFLTIVLIGGYLWMSAGGNEEKITKAKKFVVNGINGMIVIFLAYALVYTILAALKAATL